MSFDLSTLPFSPLLIIVGLGYAGISAVATGPEIVRRENEQLGWHATCQLKIQTDIEATRRPDQHIPQVPDIGGMICSAYPELGDLCQIIPDPSAVARAAEARALELDDARIARATSGAGNACACAEQLFIENQRLSVTLYAASGRFLSPPVVSNREAGLTHALNSPQCQQEG